MSFLDLNQLKTAVGYTKRDLIEVRRIADEAQAKIASLDKKQFSEQFYREQVATIRRAATEKVSALLTKNSTTTRIEQVRAAEPHWSVKKYLTRAKLTRHQRHALADSLSTKDVTNADLLEELSRLRWAASLPKLDTSELSDLLDEAIGQNAWGIVSELWSEVNNRRTTGDQSADLSMVHARLQSVRVPEVAEAQDLLAEHAQLSEMLTYAQRGVREGPQADVGRAMSEALRIGQERAAVRAEEQRQSGEQRGH